MSPLVSVQLCNVALTAFYVCDGRHHEQTGASTAFRRSQLPHTVGKTLPSICQSISPSHKQNATECEEEEGEERKSKIRMFRAIEMVFGRQIVFECSKLKLIFTILRVKVCTKHSSSATSNSHNNKSHNNSKRTY